MVLPIRANLQERASAGEQKISPSKSTCRGSSETSKGSTLSLSRYQKSRRTMKWEIASLHQNLITHSSFTDLLNAGPTVEVGDCSTDFDQKHLRPQLPSSTADYVGQVRLFG
ncbi:hypothetical protein KSP40_PGU007327 [Platanthera guangdongensis]|uniref:Uncharacterized protein n=1 Tax=Platanthera guangdongensis TaxID=2320717 RepID=A0ABR2N305_9ASPA